MAATQRSAPLAPNATILAPTWAGSCLDREALMPGGSKVDNAGFAGFTDTSGRLLIPSGTVVGRTITQRDANTPFHLATDTDIEYYITADDVIDAMVLDDVELARPYVGLPVKENLLPTALSALSVTVQAAERARYDCIKGAL